MAEVNITEGEVTNGESGLSSEESTARARLRALIEERGIKPISADQLRAMGDLWPEDESVDDFIAEVREWRRDGSTRSLF
jgi:hypothetical protein